MRDRRRCNSRGIPTQPTATRAISQSARSLELRHAMTLHILVGKICISFFLFYCEGMLSLLVLWLCGSIAFRNMTTLLLVLLLLKSPEATEDCSQHRRCRRRLLNQLGHLRSELVPSPQLCERVAPQPEMLSALLPRAAQSALRGLLSPHHGQPSSS